MNTFAEITEIRNVKDSEGFSSKRETVLAFIRVYREGRHGSERWANLAAFSEATDLFRFRTIPDLKITTRTCCRSYRRDVRRRIRSRAAGELD